MREITAHSGSQFDPDCAAALSELIREEGEASAPNGRAVNE